MTAYSRAGRWLKRWRAEWAVIVLGGVVSLHWFATTTEGMLHHWITSGFPLHEPLNMADLGMLFGSLILAWVTYRLGISRSSLAVVEMRQARFADGIILFLSSVGPADLSRILVAVDDAMRSDDLDLWMRPTDEVRQSLQRIEETVLNGRPWSWVPALIAISHHMQLARSGEKMLKRIAVITSKGSKKSLGSKDQFEEFKNLVIVLVREPAMCPTIECYPAGSEPGIDFENYEALSEGVRVTIADMAKETGNFVIDVTGGTKPCSIVAGIFSLEDVRRLEYVSTSKLVAEEADLRYQPMKTDGHSHG